MKEEILKRAMFAMPLSKDARNTGILSGFEDEMEEAPDPSEEMPQMARNPQNPEILMNTLRGDMRSVDARYMELAQMVGEEAAMETPPEVLAMLQSQFSQQGGIGGLPQAQQMAPPPMAQGPGMPPGPEMAMPPGMAGAPPFPEGGAEQAPPKFAEGGAVSGSGSLSVQIPLTVGEGGAQMGALGGARMGALGGGLANLGVLPEQAPGYNSLIPPPIQQPPSGFGSDIGFDIGSQARHQMFMQQEMDSRMARLNSMRNEPTMLGQSQNALRSPIGFAEGGVVAPPTPDGLPPMKAFGGAFVSGPARLAQMAGNAGNRIGLMASQANATAGRLMSQGFPNTFRPIFDNVRGEGGRYTAEQVLKYPTLTEHLSKIAGPRLTGMAQRAESLVAPAVATGAGVLAASGLYKTATEPAVDPERQALLKQYEDMYYKVTDRSVPMPPLGNTTNDQLKQAIQVMAARAAPAEGPPVDTGAASAGPAAGPPQVAAAAVPAPAEGQQDNTAFIQAQLAKPNVAAGTTSTPVSRIQRIKEAREEYAPLYRELLGDGKEEMYTNAMLMLADAGFKYAAAPAKSGTTPISLLAQAAQGIPQGFMALLAQAKDRQIKIDTAALSQAVSDVQEQDKYAQRLKEVMLRGDYDLLKEQIRKSGDIQEDGGAGLIRTKTKSGSFVGTSIDPKNPTVQSAIQSRYTLRDTDNPFVVNRGQAPTTIEEDKDQRIKLTTTLRSLDNTLSTLDGLKGIYVQAYGPGAWFQDKVNNLLVPISPTAVVKPNLDLSDAASRISVGMNSILKNMASANDGGRVAVQEQEWARETAKGISDPTKFFADKEIVAKQFNSMEAMLRNARQQVITQLGYEKNDYVMNTPSTGTQSDPFVIPREPEQQKRMFTFLGSTIGKIQDPRATVYLRMPNNTIQAFNPTQLRGLNQ